MNNESNRRFFFFILFGLVGITFLIKLLYLQVFDEELRFAAQENVIHRKIIYPYRGIIYDRKGNILVQNTPVFDVMVLPKDLQELDTLMFCKLLNIEKTVLVEQIKKAKKYSYVKPSVFQSRISKTQLAYLEDHLIEFKGFYIQPRNEREYPHQNLAHVLGYIGEINKEQLSTINVNYKSTLDNYKQGDFIGISGLEKQYEQQLRGRKGVEHVLVDVRGVEKGKFSEGKYDTTTISGVDLISTIDLELQKYGELLMNGKVGSIVAIEPSTGEILSMVSSPTYDPNLLTGNNYGKNFIALNTDTNKSLFNRPIMADQYPPGSIFKLLQSLIGLEMGVITPETRFQCNRGIISCHGPHSNEDLIGAIQHSCNPYFWNVFKRIIQPEKEANKYKEANKNLTIWSEFLTSFGLGETLGVDLPNEKTGSIPTPKLYDKIYGHERWKFSTIYSLAIGQGEIGISPMQMANFVSAIANRGYYFTPHLVKQIGVKNTKALEFDKHTTKVSSSHFDIVIQGMEKVVNEGTGLRARIDSVQVCGKTGTSQNPHGEDHSVFIAFAPKENPKIAVSVYVENSGQGARAAASIAGLMIEKYLFGQIKRKYIEEYVFRGEFIY